MENKALVFKSQPHEEYVNIFEESVNENGDEAVKSEKKASPESGRQIRDRFLNWFFALLLILSVLSGIIYVFLFSR